MSIKIPNIKLSTQHKQKFDEIKQSLELIKKTKLTYHDVMQYLLEFTESHNEELRQLDNNRKEYRRKVLDAQEMPVKRQTYLKYRLPNGKIFGES